MLKCLKNLCGNCSLSYHSISFSYYVYKYIEIVRSVGHKIPYKNARINAKVLF